MTDIVLVKYLFKDEWGPLEDVLAKNRKQFSDIHEMSSEKDLLQLVNVAPAILVIASVADKGDLAAVLNLLQTHRRVIKDSNVKFSVVNFLNNKQVEAALMKLGCQEVMEPTMRDKALKFKMDFWNKALSVGTKKEADLRVTLKDKQEASEKAKADANPIKWTDPLKNVDDMWISKNPQDVKKVLNRWMVKIMGPSPFVGQWLEVTGKKGVWQYTFKGELRDEFHSGDGHWFFQGEQKPDFIWKENLWLVSGSAFQFYYQEDDDISIRFRANSQAIEITKNSTYALSRERAIMDTFDQEVLVKKGLMADQSKTEIEKDKKGDGLLTQDVSGQGSIGTSYKGAVKQELPDAPEAKKKMAVDAKTAGRLSGESSTDDLGRKFYDGEVDEEGQGEQEKHRSRFRADELKNEDGDAGTDDVGLTKYKGSTKHAHSERKSSYGGESETDDLGPSTYSSQRPGAVAAKEARAREEVEPRAKKERAARERAEYEDDASEAPDNYGGDAETDDLGPAHWSSGKKNSEAKEARKERGRPETRGYEEDQDEEEETLAPVHPLRKKAAHERARGEYREEEAEDMAGKGSTDDLGEGHYSNEHAQKAAKKERPERERTQAHKHQAYDEDEEEQDDEDVASARTERASPARSQRARQLAELETAADAQRPQLEDEDVQFEDFPAARSAAKKKAPPLTAASEEKRKAAKDERAYRGDGETDDLGAGHYKSKPRVAQAPVEEEEAEEDFAEERPAAARERAAKKASVAQRKMRVLDDLLPEGNAEDPQDSLVPQAFDDVVKVDVPIRQEKKRQDPEHKPKERPERIRAVREQTEREREEEEVQRVATALAQEPVSDDGRPVTNDQATVRAFIKRRSLPQLEIVAQLDDFFENTAILRVGQHAPSTGEEIEFTIAFEYQKRHKRITVKGVCAEVDEQEGESYCTLRLADADLKLFEQFMVLYQLRQQHVHQFIKAVKGL